MKVAWGLGMVSEIMHYPVLAGTYARHNLLRDTLVVELRKAGFSVTTEEVIPSSRQQPSLEQVRPVDILVSSFIGGKPLAIDTTVVHPLRTSVSISARGLTPGANANKAESLKCDKYSALCQQAGWLFMPFGVETTGGWGNKARRLLQVIAGAQANRSGVPVSESYRAVASSLRGAVVKMTAARFGRCTASLHLPWD